MGSSWFLQNPASQTNTAESCTMTPAPARNFVPSPGQIAGSETAFTATLR